MTSKKITRKWEVFPGRNRFFCDGRLVTAPKTGVLYLTIVLITGTSCLFFIFDCPFLARRISPVIPAIGGTLFLFTIGSLFRTAFSDPGIIPRAGHEEASHIERQIEVPNSFNSPTFRPPPRTKEVLVKGQPVKLKYCYTCKIFRPPRASHCSLCDNCVDRFDHHCPWVGNCLGRRNYRFFYIFIVSLAFSAVFIFACAMTHLILLVRDPPGRPVLDAIRDSPASVIVCIVCFLSMWLVLSLAGFHTYLITTNQTTNEDIKGSFSSKRGQESHNPYSRGGICSNCWHILCGPITPSLIDRRGIMNSKDTRTEMTVEHRQPMPGMRNGIALTPLEHAPPPLAPQDMNPPVSTLYIRPLNGSYTNLYRMDDREHESPNNEYSLNHKNNIIPNNEMPKERHFYSNVCHNNYMNQNLDLDPVIMTVAKENLVSNSNFMNHNLDLDPVVLTGSKENLVSGSTNRRQHMMSIDPVCQNVAYRLDHDIKVLSDELNHNTAMGQVNVDVDQETSETSKVQSKTWADKLPRTNNNNMSNNNNNGVVILSPSKLKLLHDTTMIDTALDLDSLDGSTVSLWPATV